MRTIALAAAALVLGPMGAGGQENPACDLHPWTRAGGAPVRPPTPARVEARRPAGASAMIPRRVPDPGGARTRTAGSAACSTVAAGGDGPPGEGGDGRGFPARALHDLGRGVRDLAADGWHVVTVPTRMDGRDAAVLGAVLGVGGLLYAWDEGLYDALRRQDGHWLHDGLREVGDFAEPVGLMGNTNRWYALGAVVGYLAGWDPLLHVSRDLLASHWIAAATYNPPRTWIGRSRPEGGRGARSFPGGTSLPSGHASSIVQVAAVLSHHVGRTPASVALWGVAGAVLLQRVDSGKHWPSDVWIGAAWGYGVTRLILSRAEARRRATEPGRDDGGVRVTPWVDGVTGRPGIAVRIPTG